MMDKSISYYDIIMYSDFDNTSLPPNVTLPDDLKYRMYKIGDEIGWASLESSVGEFEDINNALKYFERVYMPFQDMLKKRMAFIVDKNDKIIATASAWFKVENNVHYSILHWVSCSNDYQGKGLGKAIVIYALNLFQSLGGSNKIFLHTQTWSYSAIGIYLKLGFHVTNLPLGNTVTDFKSIEILKTVMRADIFEILISTMKTDE